MESNAASDLFRRLDRELWLVTAGTPARRGGLIATFVSNASIVPAMPRVVVGLARQHFTRELVEETRAFNLHLLSEDQLAWVWRFGLQSARSIDKFAGLDVDQGTNGAPILRDALASLECRVESQLETGDRTVYLAEIIATNATNPAAPLTARRMIELAPAERRRALAAEMDRDIPVDARAIEEWRTARSAP